MKIIDNFLSADEYSELWNQLQQLKTPLECPRDEQDHQGLENCERFAMEGDANKLLMSALVNQMCAE